MNLYYVSTYHKSNGDHEVHTAVCQNLPNYVNRKYLGYFSTCQEAVAEAKKTFKQANGCKTCADNCHKNNK